VITPPDRAKSELGAPAQLRCGERGWLIGFRRSLGSAAKATIVPSPTTAAAMANIPRITASMLLYSRTNSRSGWRRAWALRPLAPRSFE
jgi:hypothetical protein